MLLEIGQPSGLVTSVIKFILLVFQTNCSIPLDDALL
jgi:hypothetical protein